MYIILQFKSFEYCTLKILRVLKVEEKQEVIENKGIEYICINNEKSYTNKSSYSRKVGKSLMLGSSYRD